MSSPSDWPSDLIDLTHEPTGRFATWLAFGAIPLLLWLVIHDFLEWRQRMAKAV